ncbi:MAG: hypothetical protein AAGI30_13355 [Planctomycetota bacterium]
MNTRLASGNIRAEAVAIAEAKSAIRETAEAVLRSLESARQECEHQLGELNKPDAMRVVTGRSALDRCIERTRQVLRDLDRGHRDEA